MPLFRLGTLACTPGVTAVLAAVGEDTAVFFARHQAGDWGAVDERTRQANHFAVQHGHTMYAITSRYPLGTDTELVVMTAPDQSYTRMLLATEHQVHHISSQAGYALWAATYDQELNALIAVEAAQVEALVATIPMTSAIDVGTGTGRHALYLARRGVAVTAIDPSPEMLAVAQDKARLAGLTIHFQCAAIEEGLPCATNQFDFLICALTLGHVADLHQALQECARVVRPGGSMLLTDIHPEVVALGWKAMLRHPGMTYVLPYPGHTGAAYLDAVTTAGLTVRTVIEVPVRAIPAGLIIEAVRHEFGDKRYCLLVLADKPAESQA